MKVIIALMKVIITFTSCCDNLWKSGKAWKTRKFFLLLCGHPDRAQDKDQELETMVKTNELRPTIPDLNSKTHKQHWYICQ